MAISPDRFSGNLHSLRVMSKFPDLFPPRGSWGSSDEVNPSSLARAHSLSLFLFALCCLLGSCGYWAPHTPHFTIRPCSYAIFPPHLFYIFYLFVFCTTLYENSLAWFSNILIDSKAMLILPVRQSDWLYWVWCFGFWHSHFLLLICLIFLKVLFCFMNVISSQPSINYLSF